MAKAQIHTISGSDIRSYSMPNFRDNPGVVAIMGITNGRGAYARRNGKVVKLTPKPRKPAKGKLAKVIPLRPPHGGLATCAKKPSAKHTRDWGVTKASQYAVPECFHFPLQTPRSRWSSKAQWKKMQRALVARAMTRYATHKKRYTPQLRTRIEKAIARQADTIGMDSPKALEYREKYARKPVAQAKQKLKLAANRKESGMLYYKSRGRGSRYYRRNMSQEEVDAGWEFPVSSVTKTDRGIGGRGLGTHVTSVSKTKPGVGKSRHKTKTQREGLPYGLVRGRGGVVLKRGKKLVFGTRASRVKTQPGIGGSGYTTDWQTAAAAGAPQPARPKHKKAKKEKAPMAAKKKSKSKSRKGARRRPKYGTHAYYVWLGKHAARVRAKKTKVWGGTKRVVKKRKTTKKAKSVHTGKTGTRKRKTRKVKAATHKTPKKRRTRRIGLAGKVRRVRSVKVYTKPMAGFATNRRRRVKRNARRSYRRNFEMQGILKYVGMGAAALGGLAVHRFLTKPVSSLAGSFLNENWASLLAGVAVAAGGIWGLSKLKVIPTTYKEPAMVGVLVSAGALVLRNLLPDFAETIGVAGLESMSAGPRYPMGQFTQAMAGDPILQAAAGMGEYYHPNAMGEYVSNDLYGTGNLGEYEMRQLDVLGDTGSYELQPMYGTGAAPVYDGVRPDGDLNQTFNFMEAMAGMETRDTYLPREGSGVIGGQESSFSSGIFDSGNILQ